MWSESHFVDVFVHDTKSSCQVDWKVLMRPGVFPFVGKSVCCPQNWRYRGLLDPEEDSGALGARVAQAECGVPGLCSLHPTPVRDEETETWEDLRTGSRCLPQ